MVPPEIPPPTSHGLMVAPRANKEGTSAPIATIMQQREAPKTESTPEPQAAGNDGQQKPKTETADTATHAISVPEPGGAATLPNAKDAPAATTLVPREDFAPRVLRSNQQNTVSNVVVPDNVSKPFFEEGSSIIELLQAAAHKITPEVIALQPALAMFLFAVPALLSLMYVIDREAAARAIARVLRPGGRLVGAVWEGPEQQADIELLQQTAGSFAPEPPVRGVGPEALGDPASFLAQLVDAGSKPHVETETVEFTFDNFESAWDALATEAFRGDRLPGMVELDHRNPASATAAAG
jgi:SAM-dependent methyltransferase